MNKTETTKKADITTEEIRAIRDQPDQTMEIQDLCEIALDWFAPACWVDSAREKLQKIRDESNKIKP